MNDNKLFNHIIIAIVGYFLLRALLPYLICGAIGWVVIKALLAYERKK
jgi:hypothetical protein